MYSFWDSIFYDVTQCPPTKKIPTTPLLVCMVYVLNIYSWIPKKSLDCKAEKQRKQRERKENKQGKDTATYGYRQRKKEWKKERKIGIVDMNN